MGDIIGRLNALAGIAKPATDGWTIMNDAARDLIKDASAEIERLRAALTKIKTLARGPHPPKTLEDMAEIWLLANAACAQKVSGT